MTHMILDTTLFKSTNRHCNNATIRWNVSSLKIDIDSPAKKSRNSCWMSCLEISWNHCWENRVGPQEWRWIRTCTGHPVEDYAGSDWGKWWSGSGKAVNISGYPARIRCSKPRRHQGRECWCKREKLDFEGTRTWGLEKERNKMWSESSSSPSSLSSSSSPSRRHHHHRHHLTSVTSASHKWPRRHTSTICQESVHASTYRADVALGRQPTL